MLAPRKKLWSSPKEVIDSAIELLDLKGDDTCFDIGCGDGRFLLRSVEITAVGRVVGIEIDEQRVAELNSKIIGNPDLESRCEIICGNALEQDYSRATCFFLYLIPHGLKTVHKNILKNIRGRRIRVVTYMSPLPDIAPEKVVKVPTATHVEAEWPLYYYELFHADEN